MNPTYQFTVPVFQKSLKALDGLLVKAQAYAAEKQLNEAELLQERLAPDMFPFVKQVQVACDNAKGAAARLSGAEAPSHADEEKTLEELRARIAKTLAYLDTITEASFDGADQRQITLPYFPGKFMHGFDYAREYALPNFFFHVTTAYAILRKHGAQIGKADYMGGLPFQDVA